MRGGPSPIAGDESRLCRSDHLIHTYSCACPSRPSTPPGHLARGWFRRLSPAKALPTRPGPDRCPRTESPVMHRQRSRTPPRRTRALGGSRAVARASDCNVVLQTLGSVGELIDYGRSALVPARQVPASRFSYARQPCGRMVSYMQAGRAGSGFGRVRAAAHRRGDHGRAGRRVAKARHRRGARH